MKFFMTFLTLLLFSLGALAGFEYRTQDLKLPTQKQIQHYRIAAPVAASTQRILATHAGFSTATAATVTSFLAQPDVARNLVVTPGSTTADVAAGNVTIVGKDIRGNTITENFAFLANQTTAVTGTKAFKTITSIAFPAEDSPYGATWDVGVGDALGLPKCMDGAGWVIKGLVDGVDLTGITVTAGSTTGALSSNKFTPNPASNASRNFDVLYIQNFRCD